MRMKFALLVIVAVVSFAFQADTNAQEKDDSTWTTEFGVEKGELVATGRNPYFILEPGYQMTYEDGKEQVIVTVLAETKMLDGVETRVVEERETQGGNLAEVTRNYYAISRRTNSVFYFGEEVDNYQGGKVVSHGGTWITGVNNAKFGLVIPGQVLLKAKYYEEIAPKVSMDRFEVVSMSETVKVPAGEFKNCVKLEETTPLEPDSKVYRYYALGVGLVQNDALHLVKYGPAQKP